MSQPLTAAEDRRLAALEKKIDKDLAGFVAVGQALREIRDRGLYRAHATFADYLKARWPKICRSRAYELIALAAGAGQDSSTADGQNPSSLPDLSGRALAALPPEEQRRIIEEDEKKALEGRPAQVVAGGEGWSQTLAAIERKCNVLRKLVERRGPECDQALPHLDKFLEVVQSWDA